VQISPMEGVSCVLEPIEDGVEGKFFCFWKMFRGEKGGFWEWLLTLPPPSPSLGRNFG